MIIVANKTHTKNSKFKLTQATENILKFKQTHAIWKIKNIKVFILMREFYERYISIDNSTCSEPKA